ncbi:CinA family protein [Treponema denticola]|uniref:Competence/damage-inducible protein CinA n=1 Tax=Treponema denticola (strain ATCC 35405 / DSM 14222 / CIP 103919 / JCM 8153 / KCTC 15104) TaxID=243275 RepID=Q73M05_TREDE|nr:MULTISPECIES: CinA family protein [Treponema]AAS12221.1 competence/damage-inducible protein CinA [Treponema denticola ATCC 35405]EMB37755.1 competence/damage-inducible protein CinA [Treponema denticola ATCC 33521]EMB40391.1 competence/damage-inducible protein CinA [Treponema denticola ATCC 35404]EMB42445.1 competence/damage-inducible protein CinA [Treponema denticola ASLM]EMD56389.1 competence/damage-inducible protein with CinA domain [Treponema denticola US-Trep]
MIDFELIKKVFFVLRERGIKLITAESLTGGLIASEFTKISGASEVLWGGYIVYTPQAKISLLNIEPDIIDSFGVVSPQTVEAMALGAVKNFFNASCAPEPAVSIAVSGVAGPSSLEGNPPGTVCVSSAFFCPAPSDLKILKKDAFVFKTHTYRFSGSRDEVREQTVNKAFLHVLSLTEKTAAPIRNCRDFKC